MRYMYSVKETHNLVILNIDSLSRPAVTAGSDHCFRTCCPSVKIYIEKQKKFQAKTMFTTGETVGLAEWIIDDTCLVCFIRNYSSLK